MGLRRSPWGSIPALGPDSLFVKSPIPYHGQREDASFFFLFSKRKNIQKQRYESKHFTHISTDTKIGWYINKIILVEKMKKVRYVCTVFILVRFRHHNGKIVHGFVIENKRKQLHIRFTGMRIIRL